MDPASSIVEKVVETKNGTQEVDAGVIEMATKNIDNSVESPLESNIGSNVGQSITSTDDNDDADLVIEESESDEHSSDGERTSDVAETEDLIKVAEIDKPSLSSDANSTAEINGSAEIESEDPTVEDSSIKSDPETSVLDSTKADKRSTVSEENPNVEVIDENIVIVSTSDARMANVPQETSKIIIEGDEVKRTEEVALKDCTESLTEKGAKEPTTCELTAENTKNEVFSPIENVNELKELGKNAVENKDVKLFQETQQGREANEITDQSELLNDNIRDREHLRLSNQTDFNNQILDIISDIDINIKAQEKITQLKEQELKLIQKQNELANQIHQQQILAQQLNAKNTIKQSQFQSDKFDSKCQQQNDRDVSTLTLNQNNVISKEHTDIPKTIDLRKIFTPATDATEILPKNRKLYASSAFYSPTLHPTVEDQVELARRISHSLSDISNQTSKGQSMYVNRKKRSDKWVHEGRSQGNECSSDAVDPYKENSETNSTLELTKLEKIPLKLIMNPNGKVRDYNSLKELINVETGLLSPDNCAELITALQLHQGRDYQQYQQKPAISPNILPAYSDAGKHRVQLNIHQNQLIEKYSKPGLQVVQSPWDAALQTGSASTAFLEDKDTKSQCFSPAAVSPTPYFQSGRRDFTDAVEPTHYSPQKDYNNAIASPPQSTNVPSNPQRELAYTPSVAQGWGGRNVELPKESLQSNKNESSRQTRPQFYFNGDNLTSNFAKDVQSRLYELEKFQKLFLEHQRLQIEILRNQESAQEIRSTLLPQAYQSCKDFMKKFGVELSDDDQKVKDDLDEKLNVRELIQSFEQQKLSELSHCQDGLKYDNKGLYVPKEISLSSYAAPPQQYAGNNEHFESPNNGSVSRPLPRTNFSAFQSTVGNNGTGQFPLSKPLSPGFSTVPPKQQLYSPSSYQRIPIGSENVAPQVSFNPAPLTFDKLARYEQPDRKNSTSTSSQYLNVQQNSQVRNASPTPFGIVLNEHTSGSPSSAGSIGSPYRQLLPTGSPRGGPSIGRPTSPLANKGQIFNQCARGWGAIPDKQQTYQSQFSSPTTGNLPYTDF
ncbi:kinesin-like protein KIF20B isoform X3 [Drosophila suzukii]|uniref:Kinesin-like protein KIF20B isoform X3 n=1 Tax=Drosophila suzukii TaxID=28584 RepID=A0ABM4TTI4_DROSZ